MRADADGTDQVFRVFLTRLGWIHGGRFDVAAFHGLFTRQKRHEKLVLNRQPLKFLALDLDNVFVFALIFSAFVVLGIYAMPKLQVEAIPEVDLPSLTIATQWTGASPKAIQRSITLPVEEAAAQCRGVEEIESTSRHGQSVVEISYQRDVDIEFARLELNEQLGNVRRNLPAQASQPVVVPEVPEWVSLELAPHLTRNAVLAGLEQLAADHQGHEAADEEHDHREPQIKAPDVLVVGRKQPAGDPLWMLLVVRGLGDYSAHLIRLLRECPSVPP